MPGNDNDKHTADHYTEEMLVRIARRENNAKRNYLVVDPLQGKHIPAAPGQALELFQSLAELVKDAYSGERLLLIGFAETATAIGAQAAISTGSKYIQTTREKIAGADYLFFSEEHSHATEQKLVKNDMDLVMGKTDRIVFVEDEVTTGRTILNIINVLRKTYPSTSVKYAVASLLNGMSREHMERYGEEDIELHYLVKTDHIKYGETACRFRTDGIYAGCNTAPVSGVREIMIEGCLDARRLVDAGEYEKACFTLWNKLKGQLEVPPAGSVLVMGTEEFMYPALYVGKQIEETGCSVKCHSTTRSPIAVSMDTKYPLHTRYELRSLYDEDRVTFIYDLEKYDAVIVITDAAGGGAGCNSLLNALRLSNQNITLVRWN